MRLTTSLWYYPLLAYLLIGIFHQANQFLLTQPDYSIAANREAAAKERQAAGLQPYATTPGQKLATYDGVLESTASQIAGISADIAKSENEKTDICNVSDGEVPYLLAFFEKSAEHAKWRIDPTYIEQERRESRYLAQTLLAYGRGTFSDLPASLQQSMLNHGYQPHRDHVPDRCPQRKLDWVNVE